MASLVVTKKLWSKSGGLCAICRQLLIQGQSIIGEEAHIFGQNPGSARYDKTKLSDEINSYDNLILLCGNDHTVVDKDECKWTAEKLQQQKKSHEEWVAQNISLEKLSEIDGIINVKASNTQNVIGADISRPTRLKPGTQISVDANNAQSAIGIKIGGNGGDIL